MGRTPAGNALSVETQAIIAAASKCMLILSTCTNVSCGKSLGAFFFSVILFGKAYIDLHPPNVLH